MFSFIFLIKSLIAQDAGRFKEEIAPVPIKVKKEIVSFEVDEHPRPKTTIEGLKKLPTLFKQNGLVTAGSASVSILNIFKITQLIQIHKFRFCPRLLTL